MNKQLPVFSFGFLIILLFLPLTFSCDKKKKVPETNLDFEVTTGKIPLPELEEGLSYVDFHGVDYDQDEDMDFLVTTLALPFSIPGKPAPIFLFENRKNKGFVNRTKKELGELEMIHARHLLSKDFDQDGDVDLFISGHGSDTPPFPGEHPILLLKEPTGGYDKAPQKGFPEKKSFTFYASSGQFDGHEGYELFLNNLGVNKDRASTVLLSWNKNKKRFEKNKGFQKTIKKLNLHQYMTSYFEDLDKNGLDELILGARDNAKIEKDLIIKKTEDGYKPHSLPSRYLDPRWGTVNIETADLDDDNRKDIITSTHNHGYTQGALQIYFQDKGLEFRTHQGLSESSHSNGAWYPWVSMGDLNRDGFKEILGCLRRSPGDQSKRDYWFKLYFQTTPRKFVDIASTLPELKKQHFIHCQFIPDGNKLAMIFIEYSGKYYIVRANKKRDEEA